MATIVIKAMFTKPISAPLKARSTVNTFKCTLANKPLSKIMTCKPFKINSPTIYHKIIALTFKFFQVYTKVYISKLAKVKLRHI